MPLSKSDAERILSHLDANIPALPSKQAQEYIPLPTASPPLVPDYLSYLAEDIRNLSRDQLAILQAELEALLRKRKVIPVTRITELIVLWSMQPSPPISEHTEPADSKALTQSSTSKSGD